MLMDDMSIREIARQEGCHMNAALKSVNGALKKLRGLLQDH
jgi:DNA-directed RNA polymerase specialized sigma24 family protein